ncbi:beta-glucosidase [Paraflavitalea sp. CAU 1676]|uniref:beta-glucosidase n=1 Tax=Paraflavitalea sp. CAU 1676 TaxID=3032598 RepID=UPI0023DA353D|nr:beta-glucosidase [Paraflavitalea sp. CAU 1676]MDF2190638.1 glycoside hydrolase family 3 C-terminal domain-containing protein [Paraflavitalea sp. CAU 1676]
MLKRTILPLLVITGFVAHAQVAPPYKDARQSIDTRVKDLLSRMTPEEKFWQLFMIPGALSPTAPQQYRAGIFGFQVSAAAQGDAGGQLLRYGTGENALTLAKKINRIQRYFVDSSRLGIPIIAFDEALHGLVRDGATAFPQAIALAATWDTTLMKQVSTAIATETKARGIRQILTPVVNIASDVRWGRTEETYGEDPFLSSEMGVSFVSPFERMGIVTTPKHFVANVGDGGRDSYPIHFNERLLEEIYLPPFKAAIERGGARSIMTAYNTLDGIACSANSWLLQHKLKQQWNFKGFVISDANAVGGGVVLHNTAVDYADAGKQAINNGLDVIFQTAYDHFKLFIPPFLDGRADTNRINEAVARVLRAKFELGLFEQPYVDESLAAQWANSVAHKAIARKAAQASMVLLKNDKNVLPLTSKVKTIALIGEDAVAARLGGYSGPGNKKISILDGLRVRAGKDIRVLYAPGASFKQEEYAVVPEQYLKHDGVAGLKAEYFNNLTLEGAPALTRKDATIDFHWTLYGPTVAFKTDHYSVRWTGTLTAPTTGHYTVALEGNDGYRLYIDNKLVIDNWHKETYQTIARPVSLLKGHQYAVRVEFYESAGNAHIRLLWNVGVVNDKAQKIAAAVAAAKQADVAIIVAGIHEGEFQDRAYLSLPGYQEELIKAVAATGKPVVVLLVGGSAITMSNWLNKVQGIVDVWYPGEEGGHAVADVLFGDYNPAGRLPVTFPVHEAQLPLVYNHKPTGRGDDYHNLSGQPLFPFGYGLSYTRFSYSNLQLDKQRIAAGESTTVRCTIKNTGSRAGEEVVQLYFRDLLASVARPVLELKGFQRITLAPGESREVSFTISPAMLQLLDKDLKPVIEPGDFRIMIGSSSRDLHLKENLTVQ